MLRSVFDDQDELRHDSHVFGSWLPLHHDMGLIGTFLSPISHSQDAWLMRPEHFVRRPAIWLELFGRHGVHHSAMPNFAVERVVRMVSDNTLEGMDFSGWRTLIVGSDRINFAALRAFHGLLAPYGLRPDTIKPGYGMAETTLGVSAIGPDEMPSALAVNCRSLTDQAKIEVVDRLALTDDDVVDEGTHLVVSCGRELPGARISIVDADRIEVPDGQVGELVVESPALFSGYLDEDGTDPPTPPSAHHTGDLGFRYADEVYILGRMGNSVKVNGTFVTAEDIELMMSERVGIHHDKVTVVLRDTEKTGKVSTLVVFQQRIPREGVDSALRVLVRMGLAVETSALVIMRPLAIPRTTSGKPRRIELWTDLESGLATFKELYVGAASPFFGVMLGEGDDSACR
jgi:acyl-CoA synthetase (AMP-forming)/AMP-acid ligase II